MALYVIADLHLSLGADKPMDVFKGWEDYVNRLKTNWEALVGEQDTVVLAGDISWAMRLEDCLADFTFLHRLPGQKVILKGNHDYWWSTKSKIDGFLQQNEFHNIRILHNNAYLVDGIAICGTRGWLYNAETAEDKKIVNREVGRLTASLAQGKQMGGRPVVFLHYPPVYDTMCCQEILDCMESQGIGDCYFGHIHGASAAQKAWVGELQGIKMHLISCDTLGFTPVLVK